MSGKSFFGKSVAGFFLAGVLVLPSLAHAGWFNCRANEVLEFNNRVHVRCSNSVSLSGQTIRYVAINKADKEQMARFVSLGTAATMSGQIFTVHIPDTSATNVPGCLAHDCRTPTVFGLSR